MFKLEIDGDSGVPAMVGAVQTFGDLIHWHSHIHTIVPDGVFTESGYFVHDPDIGDASKSPTGENTCIASYGRSLLRKHSVNSICPITSSAGIFPSMISNFVGENHVHLMIMHSVGTSKYPANNTRVRAHDFLR